jgi:hypothetical protein
MKWRSTSVIFLILGTVLLTAIPSQATVPRATVIGHHVGAAPHIVSEASGTQLDITAIDATNNDDPCAIASDGTYLWVANASGGTSGHGFISRIDIATGKIINIDSSLFDGPYAIAANGTAVWVLNQPVSGNTSYITQIDVATGLVTELDTPTIFDAVAIAATTNVLWILDRGDGSNGSGAVFEFDIATGSIAEIDSSSFAYPSSLAVTDDFVWVTNSTNSSGGVGAGGSVSKVTIATGAVTGIDSPSFGTPTAIAADDDLVSVVNQGLANNSPNYVTDINPDTNEVTKVTSAKLNDASDVALSASEIWVTTAIGSVVEINRLTGAYRVATNLLMMSPSAITANASQAWAVDSDTFAASGGWIDDVNNNGPVSRYGIGLLPPQNPAHNLTNVDLRPRNCVIAPNDALYESTQACTTSTLAMINAAHAKEHVLPMALPRNWSRLTVPEQLFVVADLERVDRELPPYLGLNAKLSRSAETAAKKEEDPDAAAGFSEARSGFGVGAGATWAGDQSVLLASYDWMYVDGWGGPHATSNIDCTNARSSGCWGHRDQLLGSDPPRGSYVGLECATCEMGSGYALFKGSWGSFTDLVELPSGAPPAMTFTWAVNVLPYLPKQ